MLTKRGDILGKENTVVTEIVLINLNLGHCCWCRYDFDPQYYDANDGPKLSEP